MGDGGWRGSLCLPKLGGDVFFEDGEEFEGVFDFGEEITGFTDVFREREVEHLAAGGPGMEGRGVEEVGEHGNR
jgi:hypothetical protein